METKPSEPTVPDKNNITPATEPFRAPKRADRESCWTARDEYFKCLDKNNIINAKKDDALAAEKCGPQKEGFETSCVKAWVDYFLKFRVQQADQESAFGTTLQSTNATNDTTQD
ncbi:hypothetical protein SJAG_02229 [Schizosaccharomyces japonicus yFS275]|uniref:Uncharacterized protein n=1 Tax=Schizosaccharomyces japonicus (strain yFS275 / FY16936) TaxID=402676 RepID=B6K1W6_SCHJY|nr:hypothetical protein SJAG_02229 [Schizosaccharomyces japonicus yFS275]EEB07147.1 hypothetical protein SJAG_02229 [Schizosaccharomyces japonicus yFS275]